MYVFIAYSVYILVQSPASVSNSTPPPPPHLYICKSGTETELKVSRLKSAVLTYPIQRHANRADRHYSNAAVRIWVLDGGWQ